MPKQALFPEIRSINTQEANNHSITPQFLEVALPIPLRADFTYRYVGDKTCSPGARVKVPFRGRELIGIIINTPQTPSFAPEKIKDIIALLDAEAFFTTELLSLCRWGAHYYQHPLGEVIHAALPQRFREGLHPASPMVYVHTQEGKGLTHEALKRAKQQQKVHQYLLENTSLDPENIEHAGLTKAAIQSLISKGLVEKIQASQAAPAPLTPPPESVNSGPNESPIELNEEQQQALDEIRYHHYQCYLLQGVTGSGKTEVYLQAIARVIQSGQQALVLIPEIGLSPQTLDRFKKRFNVPIAVLNSNVSEGERAKQWHDTKLGHAKIVIGTRLASLTPFLNLGIIIVDEEHDRSYKQQDGFKYSARDISIYRAHTLNIPIILGSATPSLESLHNALNQKFKRLIMKKRAGKAIPPHVTAVDLKNQNIHAGLTETALKQLTATIENKEQALIFVNRRGFAPSLLCHQCGWHAHCPNCDARMTYHMSAAQLICHYCERRKPIPHKCPDCASQKILTAGYGTEQIEQTLSDMFPETAVVRVDRDTTQKKNALAEKLKYGDRPEACIFVGTQMLAKGHHLPNLTLVVIADADQGLMSPDFRAAEKMGQLIAQVSGRAGRAEKPGHVIVQSYTPDHPLLNQLISKGYNTFANALLTQRQSASLPPFSHQAIFRAESKRPDNAMQFLKMVKSLLTPVLSGFSASLLGPLPASIEKISDRYRFTLEVNSENKKQLLGLLALKLPEIDQQALSKRTRWSLEVDPVDQG